MFMAALGITAIITGNDGIAAIAFGVIIVWEFLSGDLKDE